MICPAGGARTGNAAVRTVRPTPRRQVEWKCIRLSAFRDSLVVVCHLQTGTLEAALDIESFVCLGAVKDSLYKDFVS